MKYSYIFGGEKERNLGVLTKVEEQVNGLSQAASTVIFPRFPSMHTDPKSRNKLSKRGAMYVGGFVAAMCMAGLLNWFLVPVFGESYQGSFVPFLWLFPRVVLRAVFRVISNCIAAGKPQWNFIAS